MKPGAIIERFRSCAADPYRYLQSLKERRACPVVGYVCTYFPEEIVLAAGAHPMRLFGQSSGILRADAYIQAYSCSLVRSIFEDALSGHLDQLDVMAFPHTCDTMQRLSDIWRLNVKQTVHLDLAFPAKLNSEAANAYMEAVLDRFRRELGRELSITIPDAAIREGISVMNQIRAALRTLYEHRSRSPQVISGSDLAMIVRGAMVMDRRDAANLLKELVDGLRGTAGPDTGRPVKRILLSGGVCLHDDIHQIIEGQGAAVVWDDLCTGGRYADTPVPEDGLPVAAIARRLRARSICPAKHSGIRKRIQDMRELVSAHNIDGIIFLFLKFCDPHGFDYPDLKTAMEQAGIPTLFLEVETGKPVDGATRTRIETFLQILNQEQVHS